MEKSFSFCHRSMIVRRFCRSSLTGNDNFVVARPSEAFSAPCVAFRHPPGQLLDGHNKLFYMHQGFADRLFAGVFLDNSPVSD
jgi:hypothetical protein